jgi:hypothetical protein
LAGFTSRWIRPLLEAIAQRHRALESDFDDLRQGQQAVGAAEATQCHAFHVLHHQVRGFVLGHGVQDLHHVGVVQLADERCLGSEEPLLVVQFPRIGQHAGAHTLDGDIAVAKGVVREEDLAGRSFAELALDAVLADLGRQRHAGQARGKGGKAGQRHGRQGAAIQGTTPAHGEWLRRRRSRDVAGKAGVYRVVPLAQAVALPTRAEK